MKNNQIIIALSVIIALGAGFFIGRQTSVVSRQKQIQNGFMMNRNGNIMMGNRPVAGEITAMDDKSITVKTVDGGSRVVILGQSTKISKTSETKMEDLKVGTEVSVLGTTSQDGTVTAESIFIGGGFFGLRTTGSPGRTN